jgi:hypothetical protein
MRKFIFSLFISGLLISHTYSQTNSGCNGPSKGALIFGTSFSAASVLSLGVSAYILYISRSMDPTGGDIIGISLRNTFGWGLAAEGAIFAGVAISNWVQYAKSLDCPKNTSVIFRPNGIALTYKF